ncbi:MAG: LLM class F420-dependent oxidoreductase [Acidimicrobiia bacterium]
MEFGVSLFMTDRTVGPVEFARAVEERGFDSLYVPEHTHIPTSRLTPPPTGEDELDEAYRRTLDPFVALAAMAAVTERVRLGTGISVVAQREPIVTAKAAATLDLISGGRFDLGVGYGWNADEIAHHGVAMAERREILREHVLAMQALWRDEEAEFHGRHVDFGPSWSWPKPATTGGVPVLVGGAAGPTLFEHVAEFGAGWMPFGGAGIGAALPRLAEECDKRGRSVSDLRIVVFGVVPDPPAKLDHYAEIGVTEVVLGIPAGDSAEVTATLERFADAVNRHRGVA